MFKLKKILILIIFIFVACLYLVSCGEQTISTVDELYAMKSNKSYCLANDIDLGNREWYPLSVKNFNGNNHCIRNGFVLDTSNHRNDNGTEVYSGFFTNLNEISNVSFENFDFNVTTSEEDMVRFGAIVGYAETVRNVTVRNCNINFMGLSVEKPTAYIDVSIDYYIGGIVGHVTSEVENLELISSNIEVNINFEGTSNVVFGGIIGTNTGKERGNHRVISSSIKLNSGSKNINSCHVGGIYGNQSGSGKQVKSCLVYDTLMSINHKNTKYTCSLGGISATMRECETINCCVANCIFEVDTSMGYIVGGIIANSTENETKDCLVLNNKFNMNIQNKSAENSAKLGAISALDTGAIRSCISKDNQLNGVSGKESGSCVSGITCGTPSLIHSLSVGNTISGDNADLIGPSNSLIVETYISNSDSKTPNINGVDEIPNDDIKGIFELLSLNTEYWIIEGQNVSMDILNSTINN